MSPTELTNARLRAAVLVGSAVFVAVSCTRTTNEGTTVPATVAADPEIADPSNSTQPPTDAAISATPTVPTTSSTVASTTTVEQTTTTTLAPDQDEFADCLTALPLRRRISLLVWPAVYPGSWSAAIETVAEHQLGGVILMRPSGWSASEIPDRLAELDAVSTLGLLVATDEEGGDVQRLAVVSELPSQQAVSESYTRETAFELIAAHGARIAAVGIDVVFGPVVDVVPEDGDVPLQRSRFFSGDPDDVTAFGQAYAEAWLANGLLPVLKHFPGHGSASGDTHVAAGNTEPLDQLLDWDLVPYQRLGSSGAAVMVGHLTVPGLTGNEPATRSGAAIDFLRDDMRFGEVLVFSDALDMDAVGLSEPAAAVAALAAGIDVSIFTQTSGTGAVIDAIEAAVADGTLTEASVTDSARRVMNQLNSRGAGCS